MFTLHYAENDVDTVKCSYLVYAHDTCVKLREAEYAKKFKEVPDDTYPCGCASTISAVGVDVSNMHPLMLRRTHSQ